MGLLKILIVLSVVIIGIVGIWLYLDKTTKCTLIYGKNVCNFYAMLDIASNNSASDFDKMINLCKDMTDVPKKDSCFEFVAQTFASINMNKAKQACDYIKGFENVHSKNHCYNLIQNESAST